MNKISAHRILLLSLSAFLLTTLQARAESADTLHTTGLDEVVVVSTPKEHAALRQQPLSSTSLGAATLRQNGIDGIKDLSARVPGLFIPDYGSRLTSSIYLRGIGSRTGTPAVGMYVDGIPMTQLSSMDQDLSDAERIDVLRGPQGTLYGRNTMGGLIRVYTKNPMHYQGTDITLGAATYNNYRARVTHYHRPSEHFAFSSGASYQHQGGYFKNAMLGGKRVDESNDLGLRWRGIYQPSQLVKLDLSANYQRTNQGAYPYMAVAGENAGRVAYNREANYDRHLLNIGLNAEHTFSAFMLTSTTGFQFLKDDMDMDQDFSQLDIYTLHQKQNSKTLSEEIALKSKKTGRWQWTTGANIQYQWLGTSGPVTFYQDGIDWLNAMSNTAANANMPQVQAGPMTMSFNMQNSMMALDGAPTTQGIPFASDFSSPMLTTGLFHESTLKDLFGAKGLSLALGLRLDYERASLDYDAGFSLLQNYQLSGHLTTPTMEKDITMVTPQQFSIEEQLRGKLHHDYLQLMPRISLQYEWGETGNVYATASRGYRSGGYNIQMFNELMQSMMRTDMMQNVADATIPVLQSQPMVPADTKTQVTELLNGMAAAADIDVNGTVRYKPESAWNVELGSHLNLLDGRLKADVAAFWIEARNLQLSQMSQSGMGRVTTNAGESRSLGAELSIAAAITDAFTATASYGFTHATLKNSADEEHTDDYRVPFVPSHTMAVGARYTWNTRGWLQHITLGANVRGNGKTYWTRENDFAQSFYALLDARLTLTHNNMALSFYGNNLTHTHYDAFFFVTRSQGFAQRGTPMHFGLEYSIKL